MLKAVILTLNEHQHIDACVASLRWADEVVVFDAGSQDDTCALAAAAGATVLQNPFENFAQQRNAALDAIDAEWIFFVDADERATPALATEIRRVIAEEEHVGWWVPRYNYIFGHRMRGGGWRPDHQLRLLRCAYARYDPRREVHETVDLTGTSGYLKESLIHYNYSSLDQFVAKQRQYSAYDAKILHQAGVQPKIYTPYTQALRHFWWRLVTHNGWRDGPYGLLLATLMAYYEMKKYHLVNQIAHAQ